MRDVRDLRPGSLSEISTLSCVNQTQPVTTTLTIESFTANAIIFVLSLCCTLLGGTTPLSYSHQAIDIVERQLPADALLGNKWEATSFCKCMHPYSPTISQILDHRNRCLFRS